MSKKQDISFGDLLKALIIILLLIVILKVA